MHLAANGNAIACLGRNAGRVFPYEEFRVFSAYCQEFRWSLDHQTGKPVQRIGKTEFDPDEEFTYAVSVAADPERTIDRWLIVALASLLEW